MTTKENCKKYQIHRVTVSKFRKQGKLIGHLVDDQGRYLFEDPGAIVLGKKKINIKLKQQSILFRTYYISNTKKYINL